METRHLKKQQVICSSGCSSQVYVWFRGVKERKQRMPAICAEQVNAALTNIIGYPHLGGKKGALVLAYHQVEYIGQRAYDGIKSRFIEILMAEIIRRRLLKKKAKWPKPKAEAYGEIWCADFTPLTVFGMIIYIAVVLDAFSHYYLGYHVSDTADFDLVDNAFKMALKRCQGVLPERCMINDQGSQYKSDLYGQHLAVYGVEQVFIPKGTPWNNGEAEVGMKDIKALFYQRLSKRPRIKNESILGYSSEIAPEIFKELNEKIPRLKLRGVTPSDIVSQKADEKRKRLHEFIAKRKQVRQYKNRIKDVNEHIAKQIHLSCWTDRHLKNMFNLITHNYKHIIPEGVG